MEQCHNCGCMEGETHLDFCDMERCFKCGGQLITCEVYGCDGVKELTEEKRIPYIHYPQFCQKCGKLWPKLFRVPNEEWEKYIEPKMRDKILCLQCYNFIKQVIDGKKENEVCPSNVS